MATESSVNEWNTFNWRFGQLPETGRMVEVHFKDGSYHSFQYGSGMGFERTEHMQASAIVAWRYIPSPANKAAKIVDETNAKKFDDGKPPLQLIPWRAVLSAWGTTHGVCSPLLERSAALLGEYLESGPIANLRQATCIVLRSMQPDPGSHDMPWSALEEVADVLAYGAKKYDAHNWRKGGSLTQSRTIGAALRHIAAYERGERLDKETGLSHLAHAACELLFALTYALEGRGDDRCPLSYAWKDIKISIDGEDITAWTAERWREQAAKIRPVQFDPDEKTPGRAEIYVRDDKGRECRVWLHEGAVCVEDHDNDPGRPFTFYGAKDADDTLDDWNAHGQIAAFCREHL